MRYDLADTFQQQQARTRLEHLIAKHTVVDITEKRARSLQQNAYLHVCIAYVALQLGETIEYVKEHYYKRHCSPDVFVRTKYDPLIDKQTEYLRSSATLSKEEMTITIERFRNFASQVAGIYLPSGEEHAALLQMQNEIERNSQYLR